MRQSGALSLLLLLSATSLGCQESAMAIVVEFQIVGDSAESAQSLEVLIRCDDEEALQERMHFDLLLLGQGVAPSLAIETTQEAPCDMIIAAQVFADESLPLAVADRSISFQLGTVQTVVMTLDTAACEDLDGDEAVAGLGCHFENQRSDCDELDSSVHQGASEACNGRDDDCNGTVDELDPSVYEEECPGWRDNVGLCRFSEPLCVNDRIICPELYDEDDCDLPMDTNCDNRLSCGGCTPELLISASCNRCEQAVCERDEVVCVERQDLDHRPGSPCDELPCGSWYCDPETGELLCVAETFSVEICDDPAHMDEDCDGRANEDDDDCGVIVPSEIECAPVILPPIIDDVGISLPSCHVEGIFDLSPCVFTGSEGVERNEAQLLLFVTMPENVSVEMPEVEGCCGCEAHYNSHVQGYGLQAIVIEPSALQVLVTSEEVLSVHLPLHIQQGNGSSSGYTMTLVVPIIADPWTSACETYCDIPSL